MSDSEKEKNPESVNKDTVTVDGSGVPINLISSNPQTDDKGTQSESVNNNADQSSVDKIPLNDLKLSIQNSIMTEKKASKNPEIIPFSPESHMEWVPWLQYFEAICVEEKKSDFWKIRNIQNFLRDKALTLYINNCLNVLHWSELTALFEDAFSLPGEPSLSDFSEIKFKIGDNVNEYYQKKMKMGRDLGLEQKFILDGLTEGLPFELRKLLITNAPKTPTEWRELVFKLNKLQSPEKNNENKNHVEPILPNSYQYRQWRPQRPTQESGQNIQSRPWGYRVPFQSPQSRPYVPNNERNPQRYVRPPLNQQPKPNVHYHETLPPSPCRVCLNIGIPKA